MSDVAEKHNCVRCGRFRANIADHESDIRRLQRNLSRTSLSSKAAATKQKLVVRKQKLLVEKEHYQDHLDEVLYSEEN